MAPDVQFNEDKAFGTPMPKPRSVSFADYLIKWGIVTRKRDADLMLGLLAGILIFVSVYFIRTVVPTEPKLGADILAPGEVVPEYVKNR